MMIDAHAHACGELLTWEGVARYLERNRIDQIILCGGEPESRRNYPYPLLSDLVGEARTVGLINGMIKRVIRATGAAARLDEENERVWKMAGQLPGRVFNAYWANPMEEECLDKIGDFYRNRGFCMLKLHQCWTDFDIRCEMCDRLFRWAAEQKLPIFLHLADKRQAIRFLDMANRNPDTTFIVAHLLWAGHMAGGLEHENVCFDLSSPQLYSMAVLRRVWECCGETRLIVGSDMPYGLLNLQIVMDRIGALGVSERQRRMLCGENIMRLLGEGTGGSMFSQRQWKP